MASSRQRLVERFSRRPPVLAGGLHAAIEPTDDGEALLLVQDGERELRLRAAGLAVPYPSGLASLLSSNPSIEAVLVERASAGLQHAAELRGVGVLDLDGRGQLRGPGLVYVVSPAHVAAGGRASAARAPARTAAASPFSAKASRVTRTLLSAPRRAWRVTELATAVAMNPGNVHRVLSALRGLGLVERDAQGYVVPEPGALLEAWATQWRGARPADRVELLVADELRHATERLLTALDGHGVVSGELAAELSAPHLPAQHSIVHCTDSRVWDPDALRELAGLPSLVARHRVVIDLPDPGVAHFGETRDGLPIASPQQLYVDLYRDPGRGREAAEHVRREVLGF